MDAGGSRLNLCRIHKFRRDAAALLPNRVRDAVCIKLHGYAKGRLLSCHKRGFSETAANAYRADGKQSATRSILNNQLVLACGSPRRKNVPDSSVRTRDDRNGLVVQSNLRDAAIIAKRPANEAHVLNYGRRREGACASVIVDGGNRLSSRERRERHINLRE